jgi:hypothetical protein
MLMALTKEVESMVDNDDGDWPSIEKEKKMIVSLSIVVVLLLIQRELEVQKRLLLLVVDHEFYLTQKKKNY